MMTRASLCRQQVIAPRSKQGFMRLAQAG